MNHYDKGISVIICCYNSSARLPETIKYLSAQKLPKDFSWEIVIVDNNSTDYTLECASNEAARYESLINKCRVITEKNAGLSFARQAGIGNSKYEYILFCDDDNWLDEDYLNNAFIIMEENSEIGALGGTGVPYFESNDIPEWFEEYKLVYALGNQGSQSGDVTYQKGYVYGAGMVLRRTALESIDLRKSILSDRIGKKLASGGDIELCLEIICNNYRIWWDSRLTFQHYIPSNRMTLTYIKKFFEDTIGTSLSLYGLMYKAHVHTSIFNSKLKRKWYGRLIYLIYNLRNSFDENPLGRLYMMKLKLKEIKFLIGLNTKYDKLFL